MQAPNSYTRHFDKILRPPSAAHLTGYQAMKQENPGYFSSSTNTHLLFKAGQSQGKKGFKVLQQQQSRGVAQQQPSSLSHTARSTAMGSRLSSRLHQAANDGKNLYV